MSTNPPQTSSFSVRDYGAQGDGFHLDTCAIQQAIDACAETGGGLVRVPPGIYLTGTLFLKSNVTIHLEPAAKILASTDIKEYSASVASCGFPKEFYLDKCLVYA